MRKPMVRVREEQYVLVEEETGSVIYNDFQHAVGTRGEWEGMEASLEAACLAQIPGYAIGLWVFQEDGPSTYTGQRGSFHA